MSNPWSIFSFPLFFTWLLLISKHSVGEGFCCKFTLHLVHYSNICWIICGLFSSLLKFSTERVFFKCSALLFFPFINLGQKLLWLLCNAKVSCHCKVWLHFHKEFCSTTIASWTQSPFMLAVLYVSTADVCSAQIDGYLNSWLL